MPDYERIAFAEDSQYFHLRHFHIQYFFKLCYVTVAEVPGGNERSLFQESGFELAAFESEGEDFGGKAIISDAAPKIPNN